MRRAIVLPAPLRLAEANHHLLSKPAILNAAGCTSFRGVSATPNTPSLPAPRSAKWTGLDSELTPTRNKFSMTPPATPKAPITRKQSTLELAKATDGYPWPAPNLEPPAKRIPRIPVPYITPQNTLQVHDITFEESLLEAPRTSLGEPVKDLFGDDAAHKLRASQLKGRNPKRASNAIDMYIEDARIGESDRRGFSERDPWLTSLLAVKQRLADMEEAERCLTRARTMYPVLQPWVDDASEAIDALKEQTREFYSDAYNKWWACVPAPPETPIQILKIARVICEGKHGSTRAAASFLTGVIPQIDAERELFGDFNHPSHGARLAPLRPTHRKSVRFAPSPSCSPNFTPLPFWTPLRAQMIDA